MVDSIGLDVTARRAEPIRSCAACRTRRPQRALLRFVRDEAGVIRLDDARHRTHGRSAYLCPSAACLAQAERRQSLRRALHGETPPNLFEALRLVVTRQEGCAETR